MTESISWRRAPGDLGLKAARHRAQGPAQHRRLSLHLPTVLAASPACDAHSTLLRDRRMVAPQELRRPAPQLAQRVAISFETIQNSCKERMAGWEAASRAAWLASRWTS